MVPLGGLVDRKSVGLGAGLGYPRLGGWNETCAYRDATRLVCPRPISHGRRKLAHLAWGSVGRIAFMPTVNVELGWD